MTTSPNDLELMEAAQAAAVNSYSPYSRFAVGVALVTGDGDVVTGANVENAAYGSTMCAEAVAIGTAVASGARTIDTVAVHCTSDVGCAPCGQCRQLMREFEVDRVLLEDGRGGIKALTLDDLLPRSFGPEDLD